MTESTAFTTNPIQQVGQLRRVLAEQYHETSIVSELFQNADDAGAGTLRIAYVRQRLGPRHPLLGGPLLVVLNDGDFRRSDLEGVTTLGIGTKGGRGQAIGRFGLGMKGVFNWCEALFFAYSRHPDFGPAEAPRVHLLNPWKATGKRPHDWDEVDSAEETILKETSAIAEGLQRWFCVWIPLRRHEHRDPEEKAPPLADEWPGEEEEILGRALQPESVLPLLPLLRHVRDVSYGVFEPGGTWQEDWRVRRAGKHDRHGVEPGTTNPERGRKRPLRGTIELHRRGASANYEYRGFGWISADPCFSKLRQRDEEWPVIERYDENSQAIAERVTAEPQAAVVVLEMPAPQTGRPVIEASPYVFLPLSAATKRADLSGMERCYRLILHGAFLLGSGRGGAGAPGGLAPEWNEELWARAVAPLVLPSLAYFVRSTGLEGPKAVELTRRLAALERPGPRAIDGKQRAPALRELVRRDREVEQVPLQWQEEIRLGRSGVMRLSGGRRYQRIPEPKKSRDPAFRLFPGLPGLAREHALVFDEAVALREGADPGAITLATKAELLRPEQLDLDAALEPKVLEYLKNVVESADGNKEPGESAPQAALGATLRDLLAKQADTLAESLKRSPGEKASSEDDWWSHIRALLKRLDRNRTVAIRGVDKRSAAIVPLLRRVLKSAAPEKVPITENDPVQSTGSQVGLDAAEVARALEHLVASDCSTDVREAAARCLLMSCRAWPSPECVPDTPPLFQVRDSRGIAQCLSWRDLVSRAKEGRVALHKEQSVVDAIADEIGTPVDERTRNALVECVRSAIPGSEDSIAWCLFVLRHRRLKEDVQKRAEALDALLDGKGGARGLLERAGARAAVRHLIHGRYERCAEEETDLFVVEGTQPPAWEWLLREVTEEWASVPGEIARKLSEESRQKLGVSTCSKRWLVERLARLDEGRLMEIPFGVREDRSEIIAELLRERPEGFKRVPIHRSAAGGLIDLEDGFVDTGGLEEDVRALEGLKLVVPDSEYQRELYRQAEVPEWSDVRALGHLTGMEDPGRSAALILRILNRVGTRLNEKRNGEIRDAVRKSPWLPVAGRDGSWVAPERVIGSELLTGPLKKLGLCEYGEPYLRADLLGMDAHEAREKCLTGLFAEKGAAARAAVEAFKGKGPQGLGSAQVRPEWKEEVLNALQEEASLEAVVSLARAVRQCVGGEQEQQSLLKELFVSGTKQTMLDAASRLAKEAEHATGEGRKALVGAHVEFVKAWARFPDASRSDLKGRKLRSQAEGWTLAEQLCIDEDDIDERHVLHEDEKSIVGPVAGGLSVAAAEEGKNECVIAAAKAKAFSDYVMTWEGRIPDEALGLCLATILVSNAAEWDELRRTAEGYLSRWGGLSGAQGMLFRDETWELDWTLTLELKAGSDGTRRVPSVTGETFDAPLAGVASLKALISDVRTEPGDDGDVALEAAAYAVSAEEVDEADGLRLWEESAKRVLEAVNRTPDVEGDSGPHREPRRQHLRAFLDAWWEATNAEQLDLGQAQAVILDGAEATLSQLGLVKAAADQRLSRWLKDFADQKRTMVILRCKKPVSDEERQAVREKITTVHTKVTELQRELRKWLECESAIGAVLRNELRERVATLQYDQSSVAFELTQNADDAVSEAAEMGLSRVPAFAVTVEGPAAERGADLCLTHFGRPINRWRGPAMGADACRQRGFDADLEKMLRWASSDKDPSGGKVTGRYGFGFKTALLVSDEPEVLSGRLAFRVKAGVYPVALDGEARRELRNFGAEASRAIGAGAQPHEATVIRLRCAREVDARTALGEFERALPLLLAFSRHLKECRYAVPWAAVTQWRWREVKLAGCERTSRGSAVAGAGSEESYLVMRGEGNAAIAFRLGHKGVAALGEGVPSVWVTAPTRDELQIGFAINAGFAVDVGRAQIARDLERSRSAIEQVRVGLREGLVELLRLCEEAGEGMPLSGLQLQCRCTGRELFGSLWERFKLCRKGASAAALAAHEVVWGTTGGGAYAEFVRERGGLPTELPGAHAVLTKLHDVEAVVTGILDEAGPFEEVGRWPGVEWKPGEVMSESRVMRVLSQCWPTCPVKPDRYGILDAVKATIGRTGKVEAEVAARLGEVLNGRSLLEWERGRFKQEAELLREELKCFLFESADQNWELPARLLMLESENADEIARARFAPPGSRLHAGYGPVGREFFRVCRGPLRADADALAAWALRLRKEDGEGRRAVLSYLANGELRGQLGERLGRAGWQPTPEELQALPMDERNRVLGELRLRTSLDGAGPGPAPKPVSRDESEEILRALSEEWKGRLRRDGRVRLEWEIYGEARAGLEGFRDEEQSRRQLAWVTLLVRGAVEKMGRTTPSQHRGFMTLAAEKGWLEAIAEGSLHRGGTSGGIDRYFDEYVDDSVDEVKYFEWWLKGLAPLYLYARWLDQYLHALTSATARPRRLDLLLNPRMRPDFSGGGPDAPNLVPALGIGAHFVLRELKRLGVVPDLPDDLCYVPTERLRKRLAQLGAEVPEKGRPEQSKALFEFVKEHLGEEGARFEGWYDVPLQNACPGVSEESGEAEEEDEQ